MINRRGLKNTMHIALHDLNLEHLWAVYPGRETYPLSEKVTAVGLAEASRLKDLLSRSAARRTAEGD